MRARHGRVLPKWLAVAVAAGVALGLVSLVVSQRGAAPPEQAVRQAIETFAAGIETRDISRSLKLVSAQFAGDGYTKRDLSRGLILLNRDFERINIHFSDMRVTVSPDGDAAVADLRVTVLGRQRGGGEVAYGQDEPLSIRAHLAREGRVWRLIGAENLPDYIVNSW